MAVDTSRWSPQARALYQSRTAGATVMNGGAPGRPTSRPYDFSGARTTNGATVVNSPSMSFEAAIRQYQGENAGGGTRELYEGLFPYLTNLGFRVTRPTRAGGTLQSDDKVVDLDSTQVYDVIGNVDQETGAGAWSFSRNGFWVDGKPSSTPFTYSPFESEGSADTGTLLGAAGMGMGSEMIAAIAAQRRQPRNAGLRRGGTILAGFKGGTPTTRPATLLGSAA